MIIISALHEMSVLNEMQNNNNEAMDGFKKVLKPTEIEHTCACTHTLKIFLLGHSLLLL